MIFNEVVTVQGIDNISSKLIAARGTDPARNRICICQGNEMRKFLVESQKHPATTVHISLIFLFFSFLFCILHANGKLDKILLTL